MIALTLQGNAAEVLHDLETLLAGRKVANTASPPTGCEQTTAAGVCPQTAPAAVVEPVEPPKTRGGRKKAPAADAVIEQKTYEDQGRLAERDGEAKPDSAAPAEGEGMTLDEVREFIRGCNTDGHLECVQKAMEHFGLKKTSDMDPDAGAGKSAKYAEYVAKIQEFIDEKAAQ